MTRALAVVVLLLSAPLAWSQVTGQTCTPGKVCRPAALQMACVATGSLPSCSTALAGQTRCNSTLGCLVYCNGSSWSCVATAAESQPASGWRSDGGSTATTLRAEVGPNGISTDGGLTAYGTITSGAWGAGFLATAYGYTARNATCAFSIGTSGNEFVGYSCADSVWRHTYGSFLVAAGVGSFVVHPLGQFEGGLKSTTYLRSVGVATGSLPTCNAGMLGAIETDTTLSCLKFCNGSAWSACLSGSATISYTTDHANLTTQTCNSWTVSSIESYGAIVGDGCSVGAEQIMPNGLQLTCQFENGDGGTGTASRVTITRCCNGSTDCDPPSSYYHVTIHPH